MTDDQNAPNAETLRLHLGELTAEQIRAIRAYAIWKAPFQDEALKVAAIEERTRIRDLLTDTVEAGSISPDNGPAKQGAISMLTIFIGILNNLKPPEVTNAVSRDEAFIGMGRVLEAHDERQRARKSAIDSASSQQGAESLCSLFGMYDDCGPSYEADLEAARGIHTKALQEVIAAESRFKAMRQGFSKAYPSMIEEINSRLAAQAVRHDVGSRTPEMTKQTVVAPTSVIQGGGLAR